MASTSAAPADAAGTPFAVAVKWQGKQANYIHYARQLKALLRNKESPVVGQCLSLVVEGERPAGLISEAN